MRLIFKTCRNNEIVPFNNQFALNGAINKWLGNNNKWHDISGNYNISGLIGGKQCGNGLIYPNGAKIIVSSLDKELIETILRGIYKDPSIKWGMNITGELEIENDNGIHNGKNFFYSISPILIKKHVGESKYEFITYLDEEANDLLTKITINKLKTIDPNVDLTGFKVEFATDYEKTKKIKTVMVKNVKNVVSNCPILIHGKKKTVELCYFTGISNSTNSGFGCISKKKEW